MQTAATRPSFDRRQWTLVSLLSVFTALNTLIGRANIAVPTSFDQVCLLRKVLWVCTFCLMDSRVVVVRFVGRKKIRAEKK